MKALTVVSFHAHPDDEALLTGGTLAMLAAAGHRVVLVVATAGARGLSGEALDPGDLGRAPARRTRTERSRTRLRAGGPPRFPDSGWSPDSATVPAAGTFATVPVSTAARRLADVLQEENADLLTVYDRNGGYGHLDHVRVHDVGLAAAELAGTPRVLEATLDRTLLRRVMRGLGLVRLVPSNTAVDRVDSWFSARSEITHRVPVGRVHGAETSRPGEPRQPGQRRDGPRTAALLLRLPAPLFRRVCGTEWFIETGAPVPHPPLADPLESALPARVLP